MSPRMDTVWLDDHAVPCRIGLLTGRVIAFDPAFGLVLVEWDDGERAWETHELGYFSAAFHGQVLAAVAAVRARS